MKVLHTPTGVGSAALMGAVPNYLGKATRFPAKDNDVLKRFIVSQCFHNGSIANVTIPTPFHENHKLLCGAVMQY